ncbi:G-type lectin S-receptor-like serine/threonine-protein kinase RKS1 [Morella rubra]|uniref:Receptor-like serine/threonine-protein kinase n=1 Tax=Morella rubra TaxID=262757 RepID=A0A6A1V113_9ROSI|nr:G-type lectin S-receptor-like serine/threonine-protein kinase RKS1 [Morella rubra]
MYFARRFLFLQTLFQFLLLPFGTSRDTITISQPIRDGDVLVSNGENFALGFFNPGKSTKRYVGIWYYGASGRDVVWVANRDNPINDRSGVLSIDVHGNLVLNAKGQINLPIWSTNVGSKSRNNTLAQLLDSGNLVLNIHGDERREVVWQSFDYPTNTMLPNMKLGLDRRTGLNRWLTSWKSEDDPGIGNWLYKVDTNGSPQFFLYKGSVPTWRSGPWNGYGWSGVPNIEQDSIFNVSVLDNQSETVVIWVVVYPRKLSKLVVNESGSVAWSVDHEIEGVRQWSVVRSAGKEPCDVYGKCGAFSACNIVVINYEPQCSCLPGFQTNASGGCVRKRGSASICRSGDGFKRVSGVKVPDASRARVEPSLSMEACRQLCLQDCSCTAYASVDALEKGGCMNWKGDLIDTRVYGNWGQNLYVRVDALELGLYASKSEGFLANKRRLAILVVAIVITSFLIFIFSYVLIKRKRKGMGKQNTLFKDGTLNSMSFQDIPKHNESRQKPDLSFFDRSTIVAATDNFSLAKRLGQGGFGPVYKGQLANGQEIAVKTLSRSSRQGTDEFKNEVMLIARLQHRNLVRLFGCCIHKEERMLIYEYMPNKSLDFFIFQETRMQLLDWRKRFEIITGIARGVLYLHQDSRLKIIHRDLKASNVLLDAAMNPKISDFGLARMFGDDQIEASTNKVVAPSNSLSLSHTHTHTHTGYMSPEYAMEGLYSTKSDVFSFGVLTLEIVSGKRNNHYHVGSPYLNLIGHVWDLWMEGKALDIVDSTLSEEFSAHEVLRCIQIGLLCVQEQATDRPTMLDVLVMLVNETAIPSPNKPAFINRRIVSPAPDSSGSAGAPASLNEITISVPEAR